MTKKYLNIVQTNIAVAKELSILIRIPLCFKNVIRIKRKIKVAVAKPKIFVKKRYPMQIAIEISILINPLLSILSTIFKEFPEIAFMMRLRPRMAMIIAKTLGKKSGP